MNGTELTYDNISGEYGNRGGNVLSRKTLVKFSRTEVTFQGTSLSHYSLCVKRLVLLGLQVRILPVAGMSLSCECYMLSGIGLCDGPITRPE